VGTLEDLDDHQCSLIMRDPWYIMNCESWN